MDKITFNFFTDSREMVISKLADYLGIPQSSIKEILKDGCSTESFINDLHINLRAFDSSNVCIIGRHVTTATDSSINSITEKGLLNLKRSLQENTPLSEYLRSQKIQIDVDDGFIYIKGKNIPIESRKGSDHICFRGNKTVCSWSFGCEAFQKLTILANKLYNLVPLWNSLLLERLTRCLDIQPSNIVQKFWIHSINSYLLFIVLTVNVHTLFAVGGQLKIKTAMLLNFQIYCLIWKHIIQ